MPSYTRAKKRDVLTYVKANTSLLYGFKTKDLSAIAGVSSSELSSQLGHVLATGTLPAGALLCIGANNPKPPRVTKRIANAAANAQGTISTFCAYDKLATAYAGGWNLAKQGRLVPLRTDGKSITAVVELSTNGPLYAYSLNKADFDAYGAQLGLKSADSINSQAELNRLVVGTSLPRPGRASKTVGAGTFSTFYDPSKLTDLQSSTSGWRIISQAQLLTPAAAPTP